MSANERRREIYLVESERETERISSYHTEPKTSTSTYIHDDGDDGDDEK
jgi:hypothetical protein